MYENGKNIYDTMNMFGNIPIQAHNDKLNQIFNFRVTILHNKDKY